MTLQIQPSGGAPAAATPQQITDIKTALGLDLVANLTPSQLPVSAAASTAIAAKADKAVVFDTISTPTYTFVEADANRNIRFTNVGGCLVTVPDTLTSGWASGALHQDESAGQVTFQASGTATVENIGSTLVSSGARSTFWLVQPATGAFIAVGELGPAAAVPPTPVKIHIASPPGAEFTPYTGTDTTEKTLFSMQLPALGANDAVRVSWRADNTVNASTTYRLRLGGTEMFYVSSGQVVSLQATFSNKGATNAQIVYGTPGSATPLNSRAVDTSVPSALTLTASTTDTGTHTLAVENVIVEILSPNF